jgi:zinc protease
LILISHRKRARPERAMSTKGKTLMMRISQLFLVLLVFVWSSAVRALPEIQSWTTKKGAKVLFVEAHELPMVDIRLVFDAGSARDGEQAGVASLSNALLGQGAAGLSADEIAQGFEQKGAKLGNGSERDMAWLSLRSLTDSKLLQPALELFGKVLVEPDFPQADFKREQQRTLIGLEYQKQKPKSIGSKAFYHGLYGDHPYASDPSGTTETVKALSAKDLREFYRQYYVSRNATVVIVGDVSRKQAQLLAAGLADALPQGDKAPALPDVAGLNAGKEDFIEHPSTQSHVLMGAPGIRRGDPDYFQLYVGNHILGGSGLVSRISQEIREKRGLSYSAYSYFVPMKREGPYLLGFQTRNDQREEALSVLRDTVQSFIDKGPKEKELESAKNNIIGGFPLRVSSNGKIAEYLAVIGFYDLPLDYLARFTEKIQSVTVEQIQDAYKRRVHPDRMVTITVGSPVKPDDTAS